MSLVACPSCHRHARLSEPRCPFCGSDLPTSPPPRRAPAGKIGRAAIIAASTGVVVTAAELSCSDGVIMAGDAYGVDVTFDISNDHVVAADAYGVLFDQAAPDADAEPDASDANVDDAPDAD